MRYVGLIFLLSSFYLARTIKARACSSYLSLPANRYQEKTLSLGFHFSWQWRVFIIVQQLNLPLLTPQWQKSKFQAMGMRTGGLQDRKRGKIDALVKSYLGFIDLLTFQSQYQIQLLPVIVLGCISFSDLLQGKRGKPQFEYARSPGSKSIYFHFVFT